LGALLGCGSPSVQKIGGSPHSDGARPNDAGFGFQVPEAGVAERDGAEPSCAFQAFTAERLPLDLVILVDASSSMADPVAGSPRSKWVLLQQALSSFVRDPASAGLGIGLQFFPLLGSGTPCTAVGDCGEAAPGVACEQHRACVPLGGSPAGTLGCSPLDLTTCPSGTTCQTIGLCAVSGVECANVGGACPGGAAGDVCQLEPTTCYSGNPSCAPEAYGKLAVAIADLPGAVGPVVRNLSLRRPGGATPMAQAAVGALNHLRARLAAMPRRRAALVIATDGLPSGCGNQDIPTIADTLYTARTTNPSVPTYVIGVLAEADVGQGRMDFQQLSMAGGSGEPFILTSTGDLSRRLLETLAQIRGAALACEYVIPEEKKGSIDFGRVNLHFSAGTTDEDVPYVGRPDRCDPARGGWYYDVDPQAQSGATPARVIACPASCRHFQGEPTAKVELRFGCKTVVIQ
jgi:hypothetical protein